MKNILFVHYGDNWIRGSEVCLLNLIKDLDEEFKPFVLTNNCALHSECNQLKIPSHYYSFSIPFSWQGKRCEPIAWYKVFKHTLAIIEEQDIDCIHINSGAPCQWVSLAARIKKVPHLCQLHCHYNLHDRLSLGLHLVPDLLTVSKAVTQGLHQDGYPKERLNVVYNGVPKKRAQRLDLRAKLSIAEDAPIITSVGSLIHRKGFDRLIHALTHLPSDTQLVIIGDGPQRSFLQHLAHQLKVSQRVHLIGEVDNVSDYLAESDLFVSGARSEAFGLVLVEAFWQQLPVIAPRVGGIPEVVKHGYNGLLYQNDRQMVDEIKQLLANPLLKKALTNKGLARAQSQFSVEANTQTLQRYYKKIMRKQTQKSWLSLFAPLKTLIYTRTLNGGHS